MKPSRSAASWYSLKPLALFFAATTMLLVAACNQNALFKDHRDIEDGLWYTKITPTFEFEVSDTTQSYDIYYLIRNSVGYPYFNLFVKRRLLDGATGKEITAKLDELSLMDERTGKPLGDGLGDIFDHRILAMKAYKFSKKGTYKLKIEQFMRQNPLPEVLSVGISVEPNPKP